MELAALAAGAPVVLCPAIPELGRPVRGGMVTGAGVARPIPVADVAPPGAETPDAADDAALDAIVARAAPGTVLAGARGLAAALARQIALAAPRPGADRLLPAPALLAIGSRDPVTLAQVAALEASVARIAAPDGAVPAAVLALAGARAALLQMTDGGAGAASAGPRFARGVAALLPTLDPATLFACGGETADAVLGAAGIDVLDVLDEIAPGVPICRGGGRTIVTKSGGFGGPQLLADLLARLDG